jgi:hypothetical protein
MLKKKPYSIGECYLAYAREIRKVPLAYSAVGRRISDISEELCDQLIDQLEISRFALQGDEVTDAVKDVHLITYVRYVLGNCIKEDFLVLQTY